VRKLWLVLLLSAVCTAGAALVSPEAHAYGPDVSISVSYFYNSLAPYGRWVDYSPYGWCWTPSGVGAEWRPSSDGYWTYTDVGWTWVAYEPWGWAPYHYGRWLFDPYDGWLWVPGTTWGPAWVAWSEGDDWVGWAPLPPLATWQVSRFTTTWIPANRWCFVSTRRLLDRDVRYAIAPVARNRFLLQHSVNATRFTARDGRTVDRGIDPQVIARATGRPVPRLRAVDAMSPARGHGQRVGRGAVAFYRPALRRGPGAVPDVRTRKSGRERRLAAPEPVAPIQGERARVITGGGRMWRERTPAASSGPPEAFNRPVVHARSSLDRGVREPMVRRGPAAPDTRRQSVQGGRPFAAPPDAQGRRNGAGGGGRGHGHGRD
jgi:uncharacterized protein DUF6600